MKHAVILLSGGIDSSTVLALAKSEGYTCHALSFDYGQRHAVELEAARRVAEALGAVEHLILHLELGRLGGSALTTDRPVPKDRDISALGREIPLTYVPARNTLFLAYALAWAEVLGVWDLFIGVSAVDYSGYPDCRPEFIAAFEHLANLATRAGVQGGHFHIHAPLLGLRKGETIRLGLRLGVDYALTHSCYDPTPDGRACGRCDSCLLRKKGFAEAGIADPTRYVDRER